MTEEEKIRSLNRVLKNLPGPGEVHPRDIAAFKDSYIRPTRVVGRDTCWCLVIGFFILGAVLGFLWAVCQ